MGPQRSPGGIVARSRRTWGSVRQGQSGRWEARYLDPDTHRRTAAGTSFASKAAADRWLAKKRTELDQGTALDESGANRPLKAWWPGYPATLARTKPTTRGNYERAWRLRIEPRFG